MTILTKEMVDELNTLSLRNPSIAVDTPEVQDTIFYKKLVGHSTLSVFTSNGSYPNQHQSFTYKISKHTPKNDALHLLVKIATASPTLTTLKMGFKNIPNSTYINKKLVPFLYDLKIPDSTPEFKKNCYIYKINKIRKVQSEIEPILGKDILYIVNLYIHIQDLIDITSSTLKRNINPLSSESTEKDFTLPLAPPLETDKYVNGMELAGDTTEELI